jgi:serine/threonine protein kinase
MLTSQTPAEIEMQMKGSIPYMAPEALRQETLSRKADVWSLGCLALQLATGKQPWAEKTWDNMWGAVFFIGNNEVIPKIGDGVSKGMKGFLLKCLQRNFEERASAKELLGDPWLCGMDEFSDEQDD